MYPDEWVTGWPNHVVKYWGETFELDYKGWYVCQATLRVFLGLGWDAGLVSSFGKKKKVLLVKEYPPPAPPNYFWCASISHTKPATWLLTGHLRGWCFEGSLVFGRLKRRG